MDFSLILTKITWKDPERNRNDLKGHCSVSMSSSCVAQCLLKHRKMRFSDLPRWRGCCRYRQTNLSQIDLCREYGKRMETHWDTLTKVLDSWKASERRDCNGLGCLPVLFIGSLWANAPSTGPVPSQSDSKPEDFELENWGWLPLSQ